MSSRSSSPAANEAPPRQLFDGLHLDTDGPKRVLSVGRPLDPPTRRALLEAGCELHAVPTVGDALREMLTSFFDVVVVRASVMRNLDGLRFVRELKNRESDAGFIDLRGLRYIYDAVPFVVPPLEGTSEYAVFEARDLWYLADTTVTPLDEAILRVSRLS